MVCASRNLVVLVAVVCFGSVCLAQDGPLGKAAPEEAPEIIGDSEVPIPGGMEKEVAVTTQSQVNGRPVRELRMMRAFYSQTLQASFLINRYRLGPHTFFAARVIGRPESTSPLNRLGLHSGDLITRLDDVRVDNYEELDRHFAETSVRYIRANSSRVFLGTIDIGPIELTP